MDGIRVDRRAHTRGFHVADVLEAVGDRARTSVWRCRIGETVVGEEFWDHEEHLESACSGGRDISGENLLTLARQTMQVIDGEFIACETGSAEPWLVLVIYDSSYWEALSSDTDVMEALKGRFPWFKPIREEERTYPWGRS